MVPRAIVCLMVDIGHVVLLAVLGNNDNRITSWLKSYSDFKCIIFDKGVILEINSNVGRVEVFVLVISSESGDHTFHIYCYLHQFLTHFASLFCSIR